MTAPAQPAGDRTPVAAAPPTVLVVENDVVLGGLVGAVLADAGYAATVLPDTRPEAVRVAVDRLEPACVLLDGGGWRGYGASWELAAWTRARARPGACARPDHRPGRDQARVAGDRAALAHPPRAAARPLGQRRPRS